MREGHIREVGSGFGNDVAPQLRAFQHVHFVDGTEAFLPSLGGGEGDARDAAHFAFAVTQGVVTLAFASVVLPQAARLAEVDAAGEFAHDQDIQPAHEFGFERGTFNEGVQYPCRTQVGKQAEIGTDGEQSGFRALRTRQVVPFWPADAGEQHGIGCARFGTGFRRIRFTGGIHCATAEQGGVEGYSQPGAFLQEA